MMNVFCDLNGVLVDFEKGFNDTFKIDITSIKPSEVWRLIASRGEDYWINLPPTENYMDLWRFIEPYYPTILAGLPLPDKKGTKSGIKRWCFRNLEGCWNFTATCSSEKEYLMESKDDILIDDREVNCENWVAAGGRAILHTSAKSTIAQLKDLNLIQKANSFIW